MLEVLIQAILTLFICINFSVLCLSKSKIKFQNPVKYLLFGFFPIVILLRLWHLFFPINEYCFAFFILFCILIYLKFRSDVNFILLEFKSLIAANKFIFLSISILTIYFSSLTSISYDEGLYHAGFINWINKYKIIHGLANIESRFGFNSSWHLLEALFNGYGIWPNVCNSINTILALSFTLYFIYEKNFRWSVVFIFFPLIIIYHLIDPSADYVIYLFTMAFVTELFLKKEKDRDFFWVFAFLFLITVKINALILLPLFIIYYFPVLKNINKLFIPWSAFFLYSILLFGTWIYANFLISGYFIFPYFQIENISPLWKLSASEVINTINGINYTPFCRWTGIPFDEVKNYNKLQQLFLWFKHVRLVEKVQLLFSIFSIVGLLFHNRKSKTHFISSICILIIFIINVIMVPDARFFLGIGFSAFICWISNYSKYFSLLNNNKLIAVFIFLQFSITVYLYINLFPKVLSKEKFSLFNPIYKGRYEYSKSSKTEIDGIIFSQPIGNEFNWDVTPSMIKIKPNIKKIGPELQNGFYNKDTEIKSKNYK